jgi:Predicted transcriptional regulator
MQSVVNASVKMSPTLRERIQNLAKVRKQSAHAVMLQALETFVSREERREAWRQEGIAAWEEYKQTGLHLTQEELESWANNISQGERTPMPKCHV